MLRRHLLLHDDPHRNPRGRVRLRAGGRMKGKRQQKKLRKWKHIYLPVDGWSVTAVRTDAGKHPRGESKIIMWVATRKKITRE